MGCWPRVAMVTSRSLEGCLVPWGFSSEPHLCTSSGLVFYHLSRSVFTSNKHAKSPCYLFVYKREAAFLLACFLPGINFKCRLCCFLSDASYPRFFPHSNTLQLNAVGRTGYPLCADRMFENIPELFERHAWSLL